MDMGEVTPGWPVQVLFYGPEFVKDQPEVGKRFMVAYVKALRYIDAAYRQATNRDEGFQILIDNTPLKNLALWRRMWPSYSETNGGVNTRAIEVDQDFYVRQGFQREKLDARSIVDPSFAEYAVQVLGRNAD